ncbi:DUF397 domain-containing protein [Streptomyces monashensis]|uniref:DUF397 domain-containing protein n=1 Tax=Streptomyces monashensis TaxID=1678012 RepID=A0A1S2PC40_9ACTN|nr:DUF397 domain-containing protein [Streptomyces monashensis]OIJ90514.1 DUF397 domain-containing protein [Streptomyces monashensis]
MTTEAPQWFTSSYSSNGGACIEVATNLAATRGLVPVRDTKNPNGPALSLTAHAWSDFVTLAKDAHV